MNAWVRVERNYFEGVGKAVFFDASATTGYAQLIENHFGISYVATLPTCDLQVPYSYLQVLDSTENVPSIVTGGVKTTDVTDVASVLPFRFQLHQNYPNPFNPSTTISFSVGTYNHTSLRVYDVLGREVAILVNEEKSPGDYNVEWNAENMPSGIYFYRLTAGGYSQTKKMILIK